ARPGLPLADTESVAAVAEALRRDTAGNAFFIEEILRHLVESGDEVVPSHTERGPSLFGEGGVPETVRDVILARLSRLGATALGVLATAAVLGPESDFAVLEAVVDVSADDLLSVLDVAVTRRVVEERPGPVVRY